MSLLAAYGFEEGSGTTAADSSGGGHPLTIASGAATWATGHTGGGLAGNASGVGGVNTSLSNPTSNVTIMAWVKPHTVSGAEEPLLGYWSSPSSDPNGSSQFVLYATRTAFGTANKLVGNLRIGGTLGEIVGPALTADTWVHVALAFDGTTISLFVNGALFTSVTRAGTLGVGSFGVVGRSNATIDDVRVFDTALTAADVTAYMNAPVNPSGVAYNVSGTVAVMSGTLGAVQSLLEVAGTSDAVSGVEADITSLLAVAGVTAAHSTAEGNVSGLLSVSGRVDAESGSEGDVTLDADLSVSGVVHAVSGSAGSVAGVFSVSGTVVVKSTTSGSVNGGSVPGGGGSTGAKPIDNIATEFGGVGGLFGNVDAKTVRDSTKKANGRAYPNVNPLSGNQELTSSRQTDSTDPNSGPKYGTGGKRVF